MNDANRYQVVHAGFWWRIKIGDGGVPYGRFYSKDEAERMQLLLLREFRNGGYVQTRPYRVLKMAVEAMMAPIGYHGTISARDDRVQAVMDALAQIDEVEK
jgi:hypothetical protein